MDIYLFLAFQIRRKGYAVAKAVKVPKTNAMRELESAGISYTLHTYEDDGDEYAMYLDLSFQIDETDAGGKPYTSYDWLSVTLRPGMNYTISCLKALGLLTNRGMVTNRQYHPEYYADQDGTALSEDADVVYPADAVYPDDFATTYAIAKG